MLQISAFYVRFGNPTAHVLRGMELYFSLFKEKLQSSYFIALPQFLLVLESLELPREPGGNGD